MLFNSIEFALFLPVVFFLYWFAVNRSLKVQNLLLLGASYFFYGWWDWRFLGLIVFSSFVDFFVGLLLNKEENPWKRKLWLWISISVNIGFLGFFKYYNFFAESFSEAFTLLGAPIEASRLSIVLPVGISFYTFQTLSYSIDVYRRKLEPTKDIISFFAFVSFFPQLVAGPIERATNLLPQFYKKRSFDYDKATDGLRQILWGLVKKVVIADNCAPLVNQIFENADTTSASNLLLGAVLFSFQIYGDFSGYSDIAIGTSRLFGFNLKKNFAYPYFSRDIAEFWRRWHISLSTWFRDYVYIPLGGSKGKQWVRIRNVFIIFLVSGFWHGANWTFLVWGLLNALYFLPVFIRKKNRAHLDVVAQGRWFPTISETFQMLITYALTVLAWIFFRADSVTDAFVYIKRMTNSSLFSIPTITYTKHLFWISVMLLVFLFFEWMGRDKEFAIEGLVKKWPMPLRYAFYLCLSMIIVLFGAKSQEFIYFQF